MIRTPFHVALVASTAVLTLAPAVARAQNPQTQALDWPSNYSGAFQKVDTGVLFDASSDEDTPALLVQAGSDLVLIREPMSKPEPSLVATGVADFVLLPTVEGLSLVAITTSTGLRLGSPLDTDPPTITFSAVTLTSAWNSATELCAAPDDAGGAIVAAKNGNTILRAQRSASGTWTELADIILTTGTVEQLAIADIVPSSEGVEVAYTTSAYGLRIHDVGGTQIFSYDHGRLFHTLARNVGGGLNGVDSFCFVAEFDYGGGVIGDILCEVTANDTPPVTFHISSPIFGGPSRHAASDFAHVGADSQADFVMASATTSELIVLHGLPEGSNYPYTPVGAPEFFSVSTSAIGLTGTRLVAADDFDGDGDGDLVVIGTGTGGRGIWFFRGASIVQPAVTWDATALDAMYDVGSTNHILVSASIDFPAWGTPPNGYVDKMRVRVWAQGDINGYVDETVARPMQRLDVSNGVAILDEWDVPTDYEPSETILHFEFKPMRIDSTTGAVVLQDPATFGAASSNGELYALFTCLYPDEFTNSEVCEAILEDDAPIILGINRRRLIMPTAIAPQQQ